MLPGKYRGLEYVRIMSPSSVYSESRMSPRNGGWAAESFNSNNRGPVERGLRSWSYGVTGSSGSSGRRAGVGLGGLPVQPIRELRWSWQGRGTQGMQLTPRLGPDALG